MSIAAAEAAPRHAILVGIVATNSPEPLLRDLLQLQHESAEVKYLDVVVLDNGGGPSASIINDLATGGLRIHVVTSEEQEQDCTRDGIFGGDYADGDFDGTPSATTTHSCSAICAATQKHRVCTIVDIPVLWCAFYTTTSALM